MDLKTRTINEIIRVEGGYVNDVSDSGGETNFGITVAVARAFGYVGSMRTLPEAIAFQIYSDRFWTTVNGTALQIISEHLAAEVVDTAVNMGVTRSGKFLQRVLNALDGCDLVVDGQIGPATLRAADRHVQHRGDTVLIRALNCLQGTHYIKLVESRQKDRKFIFGWMRHRVVI